MKKTKESKNKRCDSVFSFAITGKTKEEDPVLKAIKKGEKLKKEDSFACPTPKKSQPSLSYLQQIKAHCFGNEPLLRYGDPRIQYVPPKYIPPKTKKYVKEREEARKKYEEDLNFCKHLKEVKKLPECPAKEKILEITLPSPDQSEAKVKPRPLSPTISTIVPETPDRRALELKKPKSGIIVNDKKKVVDYDSFDLVYKRQPRPGFEKDLKAYKKKKDKHLRETTGSRELEEYLERELAMMADEGEGEDAPTKPIGEEPIKAEKEDTELTKVFKKKVEQMSQSTSYTARDFGGPSKELVKKSSPVGQMTQKFRRSSEIVRFRPQSRTIKRGTLESHSYTKIQQNILKDFFYGTVAGTMHQAAIYFLEMFKNRQGLTMPVCAYCYAFLKHPSTWEAQDIDIIIESGNNMYSECLNKMGNLNGGPIDAPDALPVYCRILDKKIRFNVSEPQVSGMIKSDQKTVYNLTKGVQIFFSRFSAGIFRTKGVNIAIWRDKYYYFFDARPRTRDLYPDPKGTAMMANFYDLESVITVLLDRCLLGDWPFAILAIDTYSIHHKNDPEERISLMNIDDKKTYDVLNERKAVVQGSFDLADKCFEYTRNKQALAMAVSSLVYSRISPPSSWYRKIVDKIMLIGNQLYIESVNNKPMVELKLEHFPAEFTLGPYSVEVYIKPNMFGDRVCRNGRCILESCLEKFFETYSMAILILGDYTIAVWKQRGIFYCFDPYSRNIQGYASRNGVACVSMHTDLDSLTWMLAKNHCGEDTNFFIHALVVCRIIREPAQTCYVSEDVTLEDLSDEDLKKTTKKKGKKLAVGKHKTIEVKEDGNASLANPPMEVTEGESLVEVDSDVGSLALAALPHFPHVQHIKTPLAADNVADLESPSLSDTQIEPPQMKDEEEGDMMVDVASYQLTKDELEGKKKDKGEGDKEEEKKTDEKPAGAAATAAAVAAPGGDQKAKEEEEEFYMAADATTIMHSESFFNTASVNLSAELSALTVEHEVLEPTNLAKTLERKRRVFYKSAQGSIVLGYDPEPDVTQSEELRKESNFVELPDNSQIVRGSSNMADLEGQKDGDLEYLAPFVCIMAAAVAKKFSLVSWSGDVVEYVLKCGQELFKASKFRYDQVSRLDIPKISLGSTDFHIVVDYLFDTLMKENIVEVALDRLLFTRSDCGIFVTATYACAIFYRHHLYYLYDGYGNNEVGLSEGGKNSGVACLSRFKNLRSLVQRIVYNKSAREGVEPVQFTRFVLSKVEVVALNPPKPKQAEHQGGEGEDEWIDIDESDEEEEEAEEEESENEKETKPKIEVGWQWYKKVGTIRGSKSLKGRGVGENEIKKDHFACICACLMMIEVPLDKWDNRMVDFCLEQGKNIYKHADELCATEKRIIKNVLIRKHFFDIIVKKINIIKPYDNRDLSAGINTLFGRRFSNFIVQLGGSCNVISKGASNCYYIFDPYAINKLGRPVKDGRAGWARIKKLGMIKKRLKKESWKTGGLYSFYTFEVTSIRRAPKGLVIGHHLHLYELDKPKKKEKIAKAFHEEVYWLNMDPIPWSRRISFTPNGFARGCPDTMWHNWDIEYANDLYSMIGNIHQASSRFSEETRGKQTLCNLVLAIGMTHIYSLKAWSPSVIDSVLSNGDGYCKECIKDIEDEDYELGMDDLKKNCEIFPYNFKIKIKSIVDGTMFLLRSKSFNLYKALRYFFDGFEKRFGVVVVTKNNGKRQVAFGKTKELEYFMFDCEAVGAPMFVDGKAVAYVLRTTTLNRLLHVLTLTLRGGDFFIFEVKPVNLKPVD